VPDRLSPGSGAVRSLGNALPLGLVEILQGLTMTTLEIALLIAVCVAIMAWLEELTK
jgi:hypothetical protein